MRNHQRGEGSSGGVGVVGLLGVALVVLKLTGFIDWSWWWVTAPFWGGFLLFVVIFLVILAFYLRTAYLDEKNANEYRRRRQEGGY